MKTPDDDILLKEIKAVAAEVEYSPEALIGLGRDAAIWLRHALRPDFPPFPRTIDEALVELNSCDPASDWIAKLVPPGSKWERLQWPDGSVTIRLVDPRAKVLAAEHFPGSGNEGSEVR